MNFKLLIFYILLIINISNTDIYGCCHIFGKGFMNVPCCHKYINTLEIECLNYSFNFGTKIEWKNYLC